jgi:hypothetical protein
MDAPELLVINHKKNIMKESKINKSIELKGETTTLYCLELQTMGGCINKWNRKPWGNA